MEDYFRSEGAIAVEVLVTHLTDGSCAAVSKVFNLATQGNRNRRKTRRQNSTDQGV